MLRKITGVIVLAAFAVPAGADTRLQYVNEKSGDPETAIIIKDGKVRMNSPEADGWSIFDSKTKTLTAVNSAEKSYTVLDEETMRQVSGQMSAAMQEMKKQLDEMPPEQRAMMEKMMGGMANAGKKMVETKTDRTGKTLQKGGYQCEQVFMSVGSISRSELCVVDMNKIDIPAGDRNTLDAMQEHMQALSESLSDTFGTDLKFDFESMGGMPVYMKQDRERSGEVLKEVSHSGIDASLFEIPEGFREEKVRIGE